MTIAGKIKQRIKQLPNGYVFSYSKFLDVGLEKQEAIIKALNRLAEQKVINKLTKGKYYKPEKTAFGEIEPSQYEIVKDIIGSKNKPLGYLTGLSIYNTLGLTSQVSYTIQIGKNDIRPSIRRGKYVIAFVKQKNAITKINIPLLQILDAIKNISKIPDTTLDISCIRFQDMLRQLDPKQVKMICKLSLKYPPSTRALLGALLEQTNISFDQDEIKHTLNPITRYRFTGIDKVLSNYKSWNLL
ncbi:MAG: hypothetical protein ACI8SE_001593 [Bacteroidia bacterium]|jgi:hypothetical protein